MMRSLAAVLLLAVCAAAGYGGDCYRGARSSYSYSYSYAATPTYSYATPTYSAPAYVAPAKPTYDYAAYRFLLAFPLVELPSYGAAYQPPPAATPAGALAAPKPAGAPSAFEEAVIKKLDGLDRNLKDLGDRVERIERTRTQPPPFQQQQPPYQQQPPPQQQKQPKQPPQEPLGPPEVEKAFLDVNGASCAMCHQRGSLAKGTSFVFSEADGSPRFLSAEERESVQFQLTNGLMPVKKANVKDLTKDTSDVLFRELDRQIALAGKLRSQKK